MASLLEAELASSSVEREPSGDVQQSVAQPFGLGFGELAVEQQRLGPDEQVVREHDDLQPRLVERERLERGLRQAGVLVVTDAVLDMGVSRWRHSMVATFSSGWSVRIAWKR